MRILLLLIGFLIVAGCATEPPQQVNIPVVIATVKPTVPDKPYLPIYSLKPDSKPDLVIKSYVSSIRLLNDYCDSLIFILDAYKS